MKTKLYAYITGINQDKITEKELEYMKNEFKSRLIQDFKYLLEKELTAENITYLLPPDRKDTIVASVDIELSLSKKHNDIEIVFNKATGKNYIIYKDEELK